jgi:hypothetical protein
MGRFEADNEQNSTALHAAQVLFKFLRTLGRLSDDFTVYGLRQVRPEESPSIELYKIIQTWPQWVCNLGFYGLKMLFLR